MVDGERSLCLVKPDGVQRKLIGTIIGRLEGRGLKIVGLKLIRVDHELAHQHYGEHEGKPFFNGLVDFITSGPVVALVLQGKNAVTIIRETMGTTDPVKAAPGTIRGDLAADISRNLIHGSDSPDNALKEISLFFKPAELLDWSSELDRWIIESG